MRNKFLVILGGQSGLPKEEVAKYAQERRIEPNLEILNSSPCLYCELYVKGTACPYVRECSKIDEFQRVAAVHCTLHKPQDIHSIARI